MNIIKTTFDFLGPYWGLYKETNGYTFYSYNINLDNESYNLNVRLTAKTADGLLKKIQAEVNKCGFKVKKAKVTKVKRKKK